MWKGRCFDEHCRHFYRLNAILDVVLFPMVSCGGLTSCLSFKLHMIEKQACMQASMEDIMLNKRTDLFLTYPIFVVSGVT